MSEPFLGQITLFAGTFAPRGWAFCDGQILPINQNQALFSLFGTTFGGDGRTSFALPDLRGRHAQHVGTGPGLSPTTWGERGGQEEVLLTADQMPGHTHDVRASTRSASRKAPADGLLARPREDTYGDPGGTGGALASETVQNTGGNQPHENMQPFLALNFIVATQGIFPSRN